MISLNRKIKPTPAITITELTMSIATLTLITTIILTAFGDLRRSSKELKCIHNLGRIATASATHAAADPLELLTPVHETIGNIDGALGEIEWGGRSGKGNILLGNASNIQNSQWGTRFGRGPSTRKLNDIIYRRSFPNYQQDNGDNNQNWINDANLDLNIYKCPADIGYTGLHYQSFKNSGLSSYDHYGNSYTVANLWTQPMFLDPGCRIESASVFLHGASEVTSPARTILYTENNGKFASLTNYGLSGNCGLYFGDVDFNSNTVLHGWHGRRGVFGTAFVDGHAAATTIRGHAQPQPNIGIYPSFPTSQQEPNLYEHFRCATIRGLSWQLDIFPAAPKASVLECSNPRGAVVLRLP